MVLSQGINDRNLTMLTDFYELTMSNGYLEHGVGDKIAVFDMFFRKIPDGGGFAIFAGLEHLIDYIKNDSDDRRIYSLSAQEFCEFYINIINYVMKISARART